MDKLKERIKRALIRLVAKKVVDKVGKEKWEASKTYIGIIVAIGTFSVNAIAEMLKINIVIPEEVIYTIVAFGFGTSIYGSRQATEKLDEHLCEVEKKLAKKEK